MHPQTGESIIPRAIQLGSTVATRRFTAPNSDGGHVTVRIGKPRRSGNDWMCPFEIREKTHRVLDVAYGVDSLQALQLALEGLRAHLVPRVEELSWLDVPDLGLPKSVPLILEPSRVAKLGRLIDRETERWAAEMEASARAQHRTRKRRAAPKDGR